MGLALLLLLLLPLAFAPLGFLAGRWWVVAVPLVGWPLFYLGLARGWWGGLGDGWQLPFALLTGLSFATTLLGVVLRRAIRPPAGA